LDPDPVAKLEKPELFLGDERPVVNVSWSDAMAFCQRLRLRSGKFYTLPSEAQWEYACRAGTTTPFHYGETINTDLANYDGIETYGEGSKGECRGQTTDVRMFSANAWALYDMHGNVWECCVDDWHSSYEGAPEDGQPWVDKNSEARTGKVLRGGSWGSISRSCRSASRFDLRPDARDAFWGFRVCCLPQYPSTSEP
jgi:formylglycine-generating enzyme required for sulfatase activity